MKKIVYCSACGASYEVDLPNCPYCGTMNYAGAEKEYMEKLYDVKEEMEELEDVPEEAVKRELKKSGKFLKKTVRIILAVVVVFALVFFGLHKMDERDKKADYIWQMQNFPVMDEMYANGEYDALIEFYMEASDNDYPAYMWEHWEFVWTYQYLTSAEELLERESKGEPFTEGDYVDLFYYEWQLFGKLEKEEITAEEEERIHLRLSSVINDFESRWNMSEADFNRFYEKLMSEDDYLRYDDLAEYAKNWYKGREN